MRVKHQHRLVILDVCIKKWKRTKENRMPRIRWWNLQEEKQIAFKIRTSKEKKWGPDGEISFMWEKMAHNI